jgi:zinc protease
MILDRTQAPAFSLSTDYSLTQPEVLHFPGGQPVYAFRGLQQEVVKLDLIFLAGKWFEPAGGVSHFTAQLLRKGTRTQSSFVFAEALERLGAHLEVAAGFDTVTMSLYVLQKNLFPAVELVLDIIREPSFPEEELRQEKERFIQNLRVNNEKTSVLASREIRKTIFGATHPYGNSTEEQDVHAITVDQLRGFFHAHVQLHAAYFIGPVSTELDRLLALFNVPAEQVPVLRTPALSPGSSHSLAKPGSVQASIRLGKPCIRKEDSADYFDTVMVNHILGGYFGSRLMKNIREEKGLTYGIYSAMQHFHRASYCVISAEVNQQNTEQALEEIRKEVLNLQEVPVPADELVVARNYFIGSWQSDNATLFAVAEKVRGIQEFGLPADYYSRMFRHLLSMTPADVQAAARKHFQLADLLEVRVG